MSRRVQAIRHEVARQAASLVGTPFKLHGRNPRLGLDCVGLVACSLVNAGIPVTTPEGYALRNLSIDTWLACAARSSLAFVEGTIETGDIILVRPGPAQSHLLIAASPNSFIHAHAGLRKVARLNAQLPWPVARQWRVADDFKG